ncbi:hypothetical protein CLV24_10950 [Pontibacter ummariensis]|uniref:Uncharacterized protein n=1 Tax=Pontibacter ummariensis TaxID=1610492 RepID=A0A239FWV5_9BACT|nr:hypothetical protein [Pontibacter ummariensis]PRY11925.1 hypothetical protein CLV24_10950 [Pontibacter ummariensis]SNS60304.1 hypothetical protein SAMN06296052_109120 [Pontibacter ummariensis]
MRTTYYNPSKLEVSFAKAFKALTPQLETELDEGEEVIEIESVHDADNPLVIFKLKDKEGDIHEVVVQIIQRPDHIVK